MNSSISTSFLADTGASHHICHDPSYFNSLSPLPEPFMVNHVDGSVEVKHIGTVTLEVDAEVGKQILRLNNVLFMPSMHFNIVSLQRLRAAKFIYTFNEIPGKAIIRNAQGGMVALMSESTSGRLTLDCPILSTATPVPSSRPGWWRTPLNAAAGADDDYEEPHVPLQPLPHPHIQPRQCQRCRRAHQQAVPLPAMRLLGPH